MYDDDDDLYYDDYDYYYGDYYPCQCSECRAYRAGYYDALDSLEGSP